MSLSHLTSQSAPNPQLNPRFNSLYVDGTLSTGGTFTPGSVLAPIANAVSPTTVSQNIPAAWSGSVVQIPQATANIQLILGNVASCTGQVFRFRFTATGDATHQVTLIVHNSVTSMKGVTQTGTSTGVQAALNNNYQIVCSASIPAGTMIDAECDGVQWWIKATAALASAFTVT